MKNEDLLPTLLRETDTELLTIYSQFIFGELRRRAQNNSPDGLLSASTHGADVFFGLFMERPHLFKAALKKRTKCAIPMPAQPVARKRILQFMERNTAINVTQTWPFDPEKPDMEEPHPPSPEELDREKWRRIFQDVEEKFHKRRLEDERALAEREDIPRR